MDIRSQLENTIAPLRDWLNKLESRERQIVIAGTISLLIIMFYLIIWDPIFSARNQQAQLLETQHQTLDWMIETGNEIQSLQSGGQTSSHRFNNQSISSLAERSAQSMGVKQQITKLETAKNGVKVELEGADFDRLILWLSDMEQKYAIQASSIQIEKQDKPGAVEARVTLERNL
ncbi:MAG: type II secretion system protein GspM [Gammaproteobacteria bacterium]